MGWVCGTEVKAGTRVFLNLGLAREIQELTGEYGSLTRISWAISERPHTDVREPPELLLELAGTTVRDATDAEDDET